MFLEHDLDVVGCDNDVDVSGARVADLNVGCDNAVNVLCDNSQGNGYST